MPDLLTVGEALRLVLEHARPLAHERVPLAGASGRVLAEPALAQGDLPPFPSSAMDGFALRAVDTPGTLPVELRIPAGRPAPRGLAPGEAMGIATGGVVPDGADAVVPLEHVADRGSSIDVRERVRAGANVRPRGGDVGAGEPVVPAGVRLGPAQLGALAAAGIGEAVCARRPRAAVLVTGTELRAPGEELEPGQIYESNGVMLAAQLASAGAEVERIGAVVDDEAAHAAAIRRGLEFDVLVTTGGVSVGPHDLVRRIERELGVEEVFWQVAVKPGKPVSFGVRERTLVFGLPGNPVSSLVGLELFVRPAVLGLQGLADPRPSYAAGRLALSVKRNPHRDEFLRARSRVVDAEVELEPLAGQDSHMIVRAAAADALVLVPRGEGEVPEGARVRYLRLE